MPPEIDGAGGGVGGGYGAPPKRPVVAPVGAAAPTSPPPSLPTTPAGGRRQPTAKVALCLQVPEATAVSCHAFSADEQLLALCPNNEEIQIFEPGIAEGAGELRLTHVLSKHTQRVTGLAWSCDGRLVSVCEDRTAVVWERDLDRGGGAWRSVLVELRAPRAALCVAWSPNGARFAVGLASKDVALCHFEGAVNCWVAKKIGRARAAVGAVAWHPTSQFLATGSTDRRCSVYDVNEAGDAPFGAAQLTEDAGAWVNAVAFSPSGRVLAFAPQDSSVHFKDLGRGREAQVVAARWRQLPFLQVCFVSDERTLVACGFDCIPVLFRLQAEGRWMAVGSLDAGPRPAMSNASKRDSFEGARNLFRTNTQTGRASLHAMRDEAPATTCHTNTITGCAALGMERFSTSGLDGRVVVWELAR